MSYEPGRELDVIIHNQVMGLPIEMVDEFYQSEEQRQKFLAATDMRGAFSHSHFDEHRLVPNCPRYSTHISAAWQVVEKLKYLEPELTWSDESHCWYLSFWKAKNQTAVLGSPHAAHAICLGALRAVGYEAPK